MAKADIEIHFDTTPMTEGLAARILEDFREPERPLLKLFRNGEHISWCSQDVHRTDQFLESGDVLTVPLVSKRFTVPEGWGGWWSIQFGRRLAGRASAHALTGEGKGSVFEFEQVHRVPRIELPPMITELPKVEVKVEPAECTCKHTFSGIDRDCPVDHMGRDQ